MILYGSTCVFVIFLFTQETYCLRCYKCNQRLPNITVCRNTSTEDCNTVFPQMDSVCLKTVQRFSTGQPPWVFGQCQIRAAFQPDQLGSCRIASAGTNGSDVLETCTCLTDLCNGMTKTALSSASSFELVLPLLLLSGVCGTSTILLSLANR